MNLNDEVLVAKLKDLQNVQIKLKELTEKKNFSISTKEDVLYPIIDKSDAIVVSGAFFGDEGKGKTVDAVSEHPDIALVVRVNSGENAGHTVYHQGKKFVFHLMPSGIFSNNITAIGPNCVMDVVSFMQKEVQPLIVNNIDYSNLFIGNVHLVMPYHKIMDALGKANSSTLKGMSPIHSSKVRKLGLRLDDMSIDRLYQKKLLEKDMEHYNALIKLHNISEADLITRFQEQNKLNKVIPDHVIDFLKAEDKAEYILDMLTNLFNSGNFPKRSNVDWLIQKTLNEGKKILFEGPQSYYLSNMVSPHWRSSTSADTTAAGIMAAAGYNLTKYSATVINVHKTPGSSRIGLGANPAGFTSQNTFSKNNICTLDQLKGVCDNYDEIEKQYFESINEYGLLIPTNYKDVDGTEYPINVAMAIATAKKFNEYGATTLKPRVTGFFDCVAQHKVNQAQGPYLTISAIDRADNCEKIGLVIAYVVSNTENRELISNGKVYHHGDLILPGDPMPNENVLYYCMPVIKVMDSWKNTPIGNKEFNPGDKLPENVVQFLSEIAIRTGSKIISIGNSPARDGLIYLK